MFGPLQGAQFFQAAPPFQGAQAMGTAQNISAQPAAPGAGTSSAAQKHKKKKKPALTTQTAPPIAPVVNQQAGFGPPPGYPVPLY
jgi:hypothetical protein